MHSAAIQSQLIYDAVVILSVFFIIIYSAFLFSVFFTRNFNYNAPNFHVYDILKVENCFFIRTIKNSRFYISSEFVEDMAHKSSPAIYVISS